MPVPVQRLIVECLSCGDQRGLVRPEGRVVAGGECERCGYLGWAAVEELDEEARRRLRELPVEGRPSRLRAA
jgi:hypothetical protein